MKARTLLLLFVAVFSLAAAQHTRGRALDATMSASPCASPSTSATAVAVDAELCTEVQHSAVGAFRNHPPGPNAVIFATGAAMSTA